MYAPVIPRVDDAIANSVVGLSSSDLLLEYKELIAGAGVSIVHTAGTITVTVAASEHVHNISEWATEAIASGDFVSFWDITLPAAPKKITFANFEATLAHDNLSSGTIAAHDTTATGANLTSLTDNSVVDSLHRHSELSASDGSPDSVVSTDADGNLTVIGLSTFSRADSTPNGVASVVFDDVVMGSTETTNTGMTIFATGQTGIAFANAGNELAGQVRYQHGNNWMEFVVNERLDVRFSSAQVLFNVQQQDMDFQIPAVGTPQAFYLVGSNAYIGMGTIPDARLEVATGATEGQQAITIDQNDIDEAFIDYQGTSAANVDNNITTWTAGNSIQGFTKDEVNGVAVWRPYYDAPTS